MNLEKIKAGLGRFFSELSIALFGRKVERIQERCELLKEQLKLAEIRYMTHKITEKAYRELVEEKQRELITLEAELGARNLERQINEFIASRSEKLASRRRYKLRQLLKQKELVLKELSVAKRKYFKRQIDENSYKAVVNDNQKRLVNIEAEIVQLYKAEAKEIMRQTEQRLAALGHQEVKSEADEMVEDVYSQEVPEKKPEHGRQTN